MTLFDRVRACEQIEGLQRAAAVTESKQAEVVAMTKAMQEKDASTASALAEKHAAQMVSPAFARRVPHALLRSCRVCGLMLFYFSIEDDDGARLGQSPGHRRASRCWWVHRAADCDSCSCLQPVLTLCVLCVRRQAHGAGAAARCSEQGLPFALTRPRDWTDA